jgi:NADH-quinone oxidoreductase subunit E
VTTDARAVDADGQAVEEQFVELLEHYRGQRGALVPLLQGAQAIFGYLPEEVMRRVAEASGEPLSKVLGVATFYSQFRLLMRRTQYVAVMARRATSQVPPASPRR